MPTNKRGNAFVSGDTFWDTTYQPMDPFEPGFEHQTDSRILPSASAPLQDLDYYTPTVDPDLLFLSSTSPNMTSTTSPQDGDTIPGSATQDFSESPDILSFADPALAALFEDPAFSKLSFPSPEIADAAQSHQLEPFEQDLTSLRTTIKRTRDSSRPDARSACWTSPLCPRSNKEGTPPNPSTCDGACAPFLFADDVNFKLPEELFPSVGSRLDTDSPNSLPPERLVKTRESSTSEGTPDEPIKEAMVKTEPDNVSPPAAYATSRASRGRGRMPHNQVERKYRESLNAQLEGLRRVVPALQQSSNADNPCGAGDRADIEDLPNPALNKPSKAVILSSATSYIKQLEREQLRVKKENERLAERVKMLEKVVRCEDCEVLGWFRGIKLGDGKGGRNVGKIS